MFLNVVRSAGQPILLYIGVLLVVLHVGVVLLIGSSFPLDFLQPILLLLFLATFGVLLGIVTIACGVRLFLNVTTITHKLISVLVVLVGLNALLVLPVVHEIGFIADTFNGGRAAIEGSNMFAYYGLSKEKRDARKQYGQLSLEFKQPVKVLYATSTGLWVMGAHTSVNIHVTPFYDVSVWRNAALPSGVQQAWTVLDSQLLGKMVNVKLPDFEIYYKIISTRVATKPIYEPTPVLLYWQNQNILDMIGYMQ